MVNFDKYFIKKFGIADITFDEVDGNVLDYKNGYVGTSYNSPPRTTGWNGEGNAISFNGTNQYVQFNDKVLPLGEKYIKFKIKCTSIPSSVQVIMANSNTTTSDHGDYISIRPTTGRIGWESARANSTSRFFITSNTNVCDNKWHDVLLTWDGTTEVDGVKIYIDDLSEHEVTGQATHIENITQTDDLYIGRSSAGRYFKGEIDELFILNKVVSIDSYYEYQKILLKSNNKIYSLQSSEVKYETNMTSNTAPAPYVASASGEYNTTYQAWKVFNGTTINNSDAWISSGKSGYVQINYGQKRKVNQLYMRPRNDSGTYATYFPKSINILGSNDGINFKIIKTIGDLVPSDVTSEIVIKFNTSEFYIYRIDVLENNGGVNTGIGEILFSYVNSLTQIPSNSVENFINYGASSIDEFNLINGSKNYILQDTVSEDADGLWKQELNRKLLSIKFE